MSTKLFITYNPGNTEEQALATRLYTLASVNGFTAFLPDRFEGPDSFSLSTKERISKADYILFFSFGKFSKTVKQELQFALETAGKQRNQFVLVFSSTKGKNLTGTDGMNFELFNPTIDSPEVFGQKLVNNLLVKETRKAKNEAESSKALATLLGIGLGIVILGSLSDSK
jgi:hypothetical protein